MTDQLKRAISAAKTAQSNSEQADSIGTASSSAGDQNFDMSESSYKTSHTAVRKARRFAMQGLYEWLVTDHRFDMTGKLGWKANAPHDIAARTRATNAMHTVHLGYYHEMMHDIPEQIETLNALITQHLDREIDKLDSVEHAILLIGAYELQSRLEIPYKVVLDEAMKLNNHFGATDAHKLINAVLDRMAIELRDVEVQADTKANLRTSQKVVIKPVEVAQVDTTENVADTEAAPTASTKPRISANNTNIKRNRPNKVSTGTAKAKLATEKNAKAAAVSAEPVIVDNVNVVVDNSDSVDNTSIDNQSVDSIVNESAINDSIDNENTVEENILNTDTDKIETLSALAESNVIEDKMSESIEASDTDGVETDSAESKSTVSNDVELNDTELNGIDLNDDVLKDSNAKSND